jgi:hypothetical protein
MKHNAIYALYPQVVTIDDSIGPMDENGNVVEVDLDLVDAWVDPNEYKLNRSRSYPKIADQLDMLWHAIDSGSLDKDSDFYKSLKAVKDANPKG